MLVQRVKGGDGIGVGEYAVVLAMVYSDDAGPWLVLHSESPYLYNIEDFEIIDSCISRFFHFGYSAASDGRKSEAVWGYEDYAMSSAHRWAVIEGDSAAVGQFLLWKQVLEREFPGPHVPATGVAMEGTWVQCPRCLDAFESSDRPGVVECPACELLMNNPLHAR